MATIMVVDDEPLIVGLLSRLLSIYGHEVVGASSGNEALAAIAAGAAPDVAIVDVAMPGMSGLELVKIMRLDSNVRTPVIFLSALAWPSDVEAGLELGGQYLTKPFEPDDLLEAIEIASGPSVPPSTKDSVQRF